LNAQKTLFLRAPSPAGEDTFIAALETNG